MGPSFIVIFNQKENKMAVSSKRYKVDTPKVVDVNVQPAPETTPFSGVKYDNSYRNNVDTSYYEGAINKYKDYAEKNRATQLGQAKEARTGALKQAYLTKAQNERQLRDNLAQSGIRGGASETAMMGLANQYGQARNSANTDYRNSVNSINQAIDQNIFDYTNDMESRAEEYRQNMANAQWQAAREDYANQWQAEENRNWNVWNAQNEANATNAAAQNSAEIARANAQTEANANAMNVRREDLARVTTDWANHYIGYKTKTIKDKIKNLDKKIKNATGAQKQLLIAQRSGLEQALANKHQEKVDKEK